MPARGRRRVGGARRDGDGRLAAEREEPRPAPGVARAQAPSRAATLGDVARRAACGSASRGASRAPRRPRRRRARDRSGRRGAGARSSRSAGRRASASLALAARARLERARAPPRGASRAAVLATDRERVRRRSSGPARAGRRRSSRGRRPGRPRGRARAPAPARGARRAGRPSARERCLRSAFSSWMVAPARMSGGERVRPSPRTAIPPAGATASALPPPETSASAGAPPFAVGPGARSPRPPSSEPRVGRGWPPAIDAHARGRGAPALGDWTQSGSRARAPSAVERGLDHRQRRLFRARARRTGPGGERLRRERRPRRSADRPGGGAVARRARSTRSRAATARLPRFRRWRSPALESRGLERGASHGEASAAAAHPAAPCTAAAILVDRGFQLKYALLMAGAGLVVAVVFGLWLHQAHVQATALLAPDPETRALVERSDRAAARGVRRHRAPARRRARPARRRHHPPRRRARCS